MKLRACLLFALVACAEAPPPAGPEQDVPPERPGVLTSPDAGELAAPDAGVEHVDAGMIELPPPPDAGTAVIEDDPLAGLPSGPAQLAVLCARGRDNAITRIFCAQAPPSITSIEDLQARLGLDFVAGQGNGQNGNPAFAVTAHSSSLVVRHVSAINPRAIVFTPDRDHRADGELVVLAFARGDRFVELAVSPRRGELTFYLFRDELACSAAGTCTPADLYTPAVERNFTGWSLYEDVDLANTTLDCLSCHQPAGPSSRRILRMQELEAPWMHWMFTGNPGGRGLIEDYEAAHGTSERYGPIPGALMSRSKPLALKLLIVNEGFADQPNEFNSLRILNELNQSGSSATWRALYDEAVAGRQIPPPYFAVRITDPVKLDAMTRAYRAHASGTTSALPDITDVVLDGALADMSVRPKAGLDGEGILMHACAQCHNPRLDPTLSRARFDATRIADLPRAAKDAAIRRLGLPAQDRRAMPPPFLKELSPAERAAAIEVLTR